MDVNIKHILSNFVGLVIVIVLTISSAYGQIDIPKPDFSESAGIYSSEFELILSSEVVGAEIRYTLDGSTPTTDSPLFSGFIQVRDRTNEPNVFSMIPTNRNLNDDPVYRENWIAPSTNVYKATIVRARLFLPGGEAGPIETKTYIVSAEGLNRFGLPILSVVTDSEFLFSNETGIYVEGDQENYYQRGEEWERPAHFEFFETDGDIGFSLDAGIRIHGGTTRNRPRKSLRIYARGEYGESWIDHKIFPNKEIDRHKRLIVRNSGNDWSESVMRDALMSTLIAGRTNIDVMYARSSVVLINGEFWGIHDIRDRFDEDYIKTHYDVEEEEMTMFQNNGDEIEGNPEGMNHYDRFREYISRSTWNGSPFQFDYVEKQIDVESFIDFQASNIYFRNTDWPGNNTMLWRKNMSEFMPDAPLGHDGRWRWMIYDTDFGFGLNFFYVENSDIEQFGGNNPSHNTLAMSLVSNDNNWPTYDWATLNFRRLLMNSEFKGMFVNRFSDLLNSTFKPNHVLKVVNQFENAYRPIMPEHIARWGRPATMSVWDDDLGVIKSFAELREGYVRSHIQSYFNLSDTRELTVDVSDESRGYIRVNSILIDEKLDGLENPNDPYPWNGLYFEEYPVMLVAEPGSGFTFSGWSGDISESNDTVYVSLTSNKNIVANFVVDDEFEGDEMNPVAATDGYQLLSWDADQPEGTFPANAVFQQTRMSDPGLTDEMTDPYHIPYVDQIDNEYHADDQDKIGFPYRLTGRTRINGLGEDGISFVNTGRGRDLGALVVAVDLSEIIAGELIWKASTLARNERQYAIRLQYRIGTTGGFSDVLDGDGDLVEYVAVDEGNEIVQFLTPFPTDIIGKPYVQIRWKYYYTGVGNSGPRSQIRLDDIEIFGIPSMSIERDIENPSGFSLSQNYPNPFNPSTGIRFSLASPDRITLEVYDITGRLKAVILDDRLYGSGEHTVNFNAEMLASGIYLYKMTTSTGYIQTKKMVLIK